MDANATRTRTTKILGSHVAMPMKICNVQLNNRVVRPVRVSTMIRLPIADRLAEKIEAQTISHVRGAPMHPQTQGNIESWHQTFKNRFF